MAQITSYREQLEHLLQGLNSKPTAGDPTCSARQRLKGPQNTQPKSGAHSSALRQSPRKAKTAKQGGYLRPDPAAKAAKQRASARATAKAKGSPGPKTPPKRYLPLVLKPAQEEDPVTKHSAEQPQQGQQPKFEPAGDSGADQGSPAKKAKAVNAVDCACSPIHFPATPVLPAKQLLLPPAALEAQAATQLAERVGEQTRAADSTAAATRCAAVHIVPEAGASNNQSIPAACQPLSVATAFTPVATNQAGPHTYANAANVPEQLPQSRPGNQADSKQGSAPSSTQQLITQDASCLGQLQTVLDHPHQLHPGRTSSLPGSSGGGTKPDISSPLCDQLGSPAFSISGRPSLLTRIRHLSSAAKSGHSRRSSADSSLSSDFGSPVCAQPLTDPSPGLVAEQRTPLPTAAHRQGPGDTPAGSQALGMQTYTSRFAAEAGVASPAAGSPMCISPALEGSAGLSCAAAPSATPQGASHMQAMPSSLGFSPMVPSPAAGTPVAYSPMLHTAQQADPAPQNTPVGSLGREASMDITPCSGQDNEAHPDLDAKQPSQPALDTSVCVEHAAHDGHAVQAAAGSAGLAGSRQAGVHWPADSTTQVNSQYASAVEAAVAAAEQAPVGRRTGTHAAPPQTEAAAVPVQAAGYSLFGSISTYTVAPLPAAAPSGKENHAQQSAGSAVEAEAKRAAAERLANYQRLLHQASAKGARQQPQHSAAAAAEHARARMAAQLMPPPKPKPVDHLAALYAAMGRQPPPRPPVNMPAQRVGPAPSATAATAATTPAAQRPTGVRSPADAAKVYSTFVWQRDALAFAERCNRAAAGLPEQDPGNEATAAAAADMMCCAELAVTGYTQPGTGVGVFYRSPDAEGEQPSSSGRREDIVKAFCQERRGERGYHRQFVAASYAALWARCNSLPAHERHYYEVIQEGRPCHLYFDLEFAVGCNADVRGDVLVEKLLGLVQQHLKSTWGFEMQPDWVVELDSSAPTKFSRHITVRIPGHAFPNNHAIGCLVAQLLSTPEAMQLMVRKGGDEDGGDSYTAFVDTAVYTKNRHFRMVWNSKGGKAAILTPTERYATAPGHGWSRQQLFLESLICNVPTGAKLLHVDGSNIGLLSGSRWGGAGHAGRTCLPVSPRSAAGGVKLVRMCDEGEAVPTGLDLQRMQAWAEAAKGFVERMASERAGGQPAFARTIAHCGLAGTVAYSMIGPGSHYCESVGRCHTSNHVYYVVNFLEGVFAQKCHDPDCASFRSAWMPLPAELRLT